MNVPGSSDDNISLLMVPPTKWYDRLANWIGDRCSPILIKECRQALKSRQFLWTFVVLLLAVVTWSVWGLSMSVSSGVNEAGPMLLSGYLWILGFPLSVVVPFSCFRSLAREYEDETIHLMTITTMTPYKIINGKMVSAMLQMWLYFAAVTPCIAFTYLLRGVSLTQIYFPLIFAVIGSTALCALGLMLGGLTRSLFFRMAISVLFIGMVLLIYWGWCAFVLFGIVEGEMIFEDQGMIAMLMVMGWIASTGLVCYQAAAAIISFPAENRSTALRVTMMVQVVVIVAPILATFIIDGALVVSPEFIVFLITMIVCHYWLLMGSMMGTESPGMSERVRRTLPKSIVGQSFMSLLMPGPGRGYLFALTNMWGWGGIVLVGSASIQAIAEFVSWEFLAQWDQNTRTVNYLSFAASSLANCVYATFYLSTVVLLGYLIRGRNRKSNPIMGLLLLIFVFAMVHVGTVSAHLFFTASSYSDAYEANQFTLLLTGNWWWFLSDAFDNPNLSQADYLLSLTLLSGATAILVIICLYKSLPELIAPPSKVPARVLEEVERRRKARAPSSGESIEDIFAARESLRPR